MCSKLQLRGVMLCCKPELMLLVACFHLYSLVLLEFICNKILTIDENIFCTKEIIAEDILEFVNILMISFIIWDAIMFLVPHSCLTWRDIPLLVTASPLPISLFMPLVLSDALTAYVCFLSAANVRGRLWRRLLYLIRSMTIRRVHLALIFESLSLRML